MSGKEVVGKFSGCDWLDGDDIDRDLKAQRQSDCEQEAVMFFGEAEKFYWYAKNAYQPDSGHTITRSRAWATQKGTGADFLRSHICGAAASDCEAQVNRRAAALGLTPLTPGADVKLHRGADTDIDELLDHKQKLKDQSWKFLPMSGCQRPPPNSRKWYQKLETINAQKCPPSNHVDTYFGSPAGTDECV